MSPCLHGRGRGAPHHDLLQMDSIMGHDEHITVMLISDGTAQNRQYTIRKNRTKRLLISMGSVFVFCLIFTGIGLWMWPTQVLRANRDRREAIQNATLFETQLNSINEQHAGETAKLKAQHAAEVQKMEQAHAAAMALARVEFEKRFSDLEKVHTAYVEETTGRVTRMEDMLGQLEDVTGVELLVERVEDIGDAPVEGEGAEALDGAGGPPYVVLGQIDAEAITQYDRNILLSMDRQIQSLDQYYLNAESALAVLKKQQEWFARTPLIAPLAGAFRYTSGYGNRIHPVLKTKDFHPGQDLAAKTGTPIIAPADGVVKTVQTQPVNGKGMYFEIDHGRGAGFGGLQSKPVYYRTTYLHCSKILVKKGQTVKRGEIIAEVGNTGLSTGPHLHYELQLNGATQNPKNYILDRPPE